MEAIKFEKVNFSYRSEEESGNDVFDFDSAFALNEIDFSVQEGEFVAVLGHNGSGKSTLARLTNGLLRPDAGKITVLGMDVSEEDNLFEIRKNVGIVFQNPDNQTVASIIEDDVAFGPENIGVEREEIGARIDFALNAVGMSEYRHATTTRLSGGQKQRIAIAGVLALKPRVMILDESTAMLDPRGRKEVMDVVLRLNKEENITIILITHFPEEALLADRAVVMNQGKIVMDGTPREILVKENALKECSLTLPKPIELCKRLQDMGVSVSTSFDVETIVDELADFLKTKGAGTRSKDTALPITPCKGEGDFSQNAKFDIVCENLSYTYNAKSPFATHALNGVDLTIESGQFFGVIGHTGSGKSTFVQHLNALIKLPTAEKKYKAKKRKKNAPDLPKTVLRVGEYDLTNKTTDFRALRKDVGMVFQYPEHQLFAETVEEDVAFGLKNFRNDLSEEEKLIAVREAIETVGLSFEQVRKSSPFELSGGQRRRVAIAGVIVTKPKVLILDEPAAGLDPIGKKEIMRLLHDVHEKWCETVIIVSHDMDEIAENCTGMAIFADGKVTACGTPKTLFGNSSITGDASLDIPFISKIVQGLHARGLSFDSDVTLDGFVKQVKAHLQTAKGDEKDA